MLTISVLDWRDAAGHDHHIAVRGGVLTVRDGARVEVATREAVGEDTLARLGDAVLARFREEAAAEQESRVSATRLHLAAIRQISRYLDSGRAPSQVPPFARGPSEPPGEGEAP